MPETCCMKGTPLYILKNMPIKQLCNREGQGFATALRAWIVSGAFEKQAPADLTSSVNMSP